MPCGTGACCCGTPCPVVNPLIRLIKDGTASCDVYDERWITELQYTTPGYFGFSTPPECTPFENREILCVYKSGTLHGNIDLGRTDESDGLVVRFRRKPWYLQSSNTYAYIVDYHSWADSGELWKLVHDGSPFSGFSTNTSYVASGTCRPCYPPGIQAVDTPRIFPSADLSTKSFTVTTPSGSETFAFGDLVSSLVADDWVYAARYAMTSPARSFAFGGGFYTLYSGLPHVSLNTPTSGIVYIYPQCPGGTRLLLPRDPFDPFTETYTGFPDVTITES